MQTNVRAGRDDLGGPKNRHGPKYEPHLDRRWFIAETSLLFGNGVGLPGAAPMLQSLEGANNCGSELFGLVWDSRVLQQRREGEGRGHGQSRNPRYRRK